MMKLPQFSKSDHDTWRLLFNRQAKLRDQQLVPEFSEGLKKLNIEADKIPDLNELNHKLITLTGWQGVYVSGFVEALDFFKMLSEKKFPIGSFIRDKKDLSYTPAPDIFHDLYGHIPFYTIKEYANFSEQFGSSVLKYAQTPEIINEFQRLFWFTVEFALIKTEKGKRIFGAGIASSFSECEYALSDKPRLHKFDLEDIRHKEFRIDLMQEDLYLLDSVDELYHCLGQFVLPYQEQLVANISS